MYLLGSFILQKLKKILIANPELWGCAIFWSKMAHLSWTKYFGYKPLLLLSSTYWPFSFVQNLKNILTADLQLWGCAIFGPKMAHLPQTFFWKKLLRSFLSTYWLLSMCKIFQKFLQWIQTYEDVPFLGLKWPICWNEIFFFFFFKKPVNKSCSFHSCLSTCQKSKSDINLFMKYWPLLTIISLVETHFWL